MTFENVILNKVAGAMGFCGHAEFYNGTLFVKCNEAQARTIYHRLAHDYPGCVRINVIGNEYAFDFVVPAERAEVEEEEIYSPYLGAL